MRKLIQRYYDKEMMEVTVGMYLICAGLLYLALDVFLDRLYDALVAWGIIPAIAHFFGW